MSSACERSSASQPQWPGGILDRVCAVQEGSMGTWNAFYVGRTDDAALATVRRQFGGAAIEVAPAFIEVRLADTTWDPPVDKLVGLSRELSADVIWLSLQSAVDALQYHHWRGGTRLRSLVYGCYGPEERTWERVEGTPEPWEEAVFFDPEELGHALEDAEGDETAQEELRSVWRQKALVVGRTLPAVYAKDCAHKIAAQLGLPH
jgi:hypothetical protein